MRIQTRRQQAATARQIADLRERLAAAVADAQTQTSSASRLAGRVDRIEANAQGARAALAAAHRELKATCDRQQELIEQLTHENQGLRRQLDDALGYTPEQVAAINSGKGEPRRPIAK